MPVMIFMLPASVLPLRFPFLNLCVRYRNDGSYGSDLESRRFYTKGGAHRSNEKEISRDRVSWQTH
jgi:hypothetical protein